MRNPERPVPWHYIRPNEASRYPRRIICLDSEAVIDRHANGQTHRMMLAAASFDTIDRHTLEPARSETTVEVEPAELWRWVTGKVTQGERTILFAHNLGYDLRLTGALVELPKLGWTLEFAALNGRTAILRWRLERRSLVMCDSSSWLPKPLGELGRLLGLDKPPLPGPDAGESEWAARCQADVTILRRAMLDVLGWLERNDCGSWRASGPAQAWGCYRHRFMPRYQLLVHRDPEVLAAERRAAWTGRCEVWRHGETGGRVYELDFERAYLRIARSAELPIRLLGRVARISPQRFETSTARRRLLLNVTVTTDLPVVPTSVEGRIVWPTGRFDTTLWDCEVRLALESGARVDIAGGWVYGRAPVLAEWAQWLDGQLEGPDDATSELIRVMLKSWARTLIGRFGLRYPDWRQIGELPDPAVELEPLVDIDTGDDGQLLQVGHDWFEQVGAREAPDSMPAVTSYVMAEARCQLWRAMLAAGLEHVYYVDTDALLVDDAGRRRLKRAQLAGVGQGLRVKSSYARASIGAPRRIVVDGQARVAGLPRNAVPVAPNEFRAQRWESLATSLRRRRPTTVEVREGLFKLRAPDRRRRHLRGGRTAAFELGDGD